MKYNINFATRSLLLLSFVFIAAGPIFSAELEQLLSPLSSEARRSLEDTGALHRTVDSKDDIEYLPEHFFSDSIQKNVDSIKPNVLSETLLLVRTEVQEDDMLTLYNALRRISLFDEITFFNEEKEKVRSLFDSSFHVKDKKNSAPLPDPVVDSIPEKDSFIVLQELSHFGEIYSEYSFEAKNEGFLFTGINLTGVPYKIFTPVKDGNMLTHILAVEGDDFILVYGLGGSRVMNPLGLFSGIIESRFGYRTMGLFKWFEENYVNTIREQ